MMSSKLCVCVPRRTGFPRSRWLYNDSGAVGLLFFQLMSLGKFVDGDNDIFGYVFQLASIVCRFYKNTDYSVERQCFYSFFVRKDKTCEM